MKFHLRKKAARKSRQSGVTLIETMIALVIFLVAAVGILSLAAVATSTTENQGHLAARTAEYAQDKMEQLMALAYSDCDPVLLGVCSDTTVFPTVSGAGTGLAPGGSSDPNAPVAGYVDYLDANGNLLPSANGAAPANWYYKRVWQVAAGPIANTKQITVTAIVAGGIGGNGLTPQSTVTALKTFPF